MTYDETRLILAALKAAYPQAYKGLTVQDAEVMIKLWQEMLDHPYPVVEAAVKYIIASSTSDWPPNVGQVNEKIRQMVCKDDMTEAEAWGYVSKAIEDSHYHAEERFAKLPPSVQRLVGSPSQLRTWSTMDAATVESVVASNFQRSFRERAKSEREYQALPESIRKTVDGIAAGMQLPQLPESTDAAFNRTRSEKIAAVAAHEIGGTNA